ncbi:MAG: DUF1801 domain-containing protein [Candidatus Saccharimonadales bacterium]
MNAVDTYLAQVPAPQKAELERIRALVKQSIPEAEESISYMMPAFKYKQKPLLYYAAFKHHMSVFPTSGPTETLKDKLTGFVVSKGTIQFTPEKPLPDALLKDILRVRMAEIDAA